ncbi:MAG: hypothetical protein OXI54_16710 [Chloroflexota bacterium]|nr:hypothetical protein [Chloroflexota bacterium]MDE2685769.1 hypothetical protein [Chloroflexota bacterium]
MPPRIRRESPARQDARIRKHTAQARDYWPKWPGHLADGDFCQAGEKGWGAVAQLTKAVATLRGWDHYDHVAIRDTINALADELPQLGDTIDDGLSAAERMHGNFYEVYMDARRVQIAMRRVLPLLEILWDLLPDEYTDGTSFAEWVEQA